MSKQYKLTSPKLLWIIMALMLFLFTILAVYKPSVTKATPNGTLVGAIRWDGQVGSLNNVGTEEERAMAPNQWHSRLPFYATEPTADSDTMRETTQAIMDQDIAYAKDAGINYWAFDWYPSSSGMDTARNLYLSSTHRFDGVNWCMIMFTSTMTASDITWLVGQFQTTNYQKVLGGRPLVYAMDYQPIDPAQIASLRSQTVAAMGVQPYIVALDTFLASQIGADAISSYVMSGSNGQTYSSLASSDRTAWDSYKNSGYKVIPWATQGWDPRPRMQLNPPYLFASYAANNWSQVSTPSEFSTQLQSAINWNAANPVSAEANAVLMYAWNEFSEGGYISPTLIPGGGGINRDYLDAVKSVTSLTFGANYKIVNKTYGTALHNTGELYNNMSGVYRIASTPTTWNLAEQIWQLQDAGNGYYKFVNQRYGNLLQSTYDIYNSLAGVYYTASTPSTWNLNEQLWQIQYAGNGYYKLVNKGNGNLLHNTGDIYNGVSGAYNVITVPSSWNYDSELWQLFKQ